MKNARIKITALLLLLAAIGQCLTGTGIHAAYAYDEGYDAKIIAESLADFFAARFEDPSEELDANDDWAIADLASWGYEFTDAVRARFKERLTALVSDDNAKNAVLVRCVIAMAAVDIRGETFENACERLAAASESEKSIYLLPYMLIALKQSGDRYESECLILRDKILAAELEDGGFNGFGKIPDADTTGPVLLALSYYPDCAQVCSRAAELVLRTEDENGVIPRSNGSSACSAGVLIPGLCAAGADAEKTAAGLVSLYDCDNMYSMNPNDRLSREQAMRGLIAYLTGGRIYEFGER